MQEARAEEERMAARFLNDGEIAKAKRDFELKKAAYDMEVQTKKADSELAYDLQVKRQAIKSFTRVFLIELKESAVLVEWINFILQPGQGIDRHWTPPV